MAASSSSSSLLNDSRIKHDLFVSFRGEDIRTSFLSHLRKELHRNSIDFFLDDEKIHPGDEVSSTLLQAIEESLISLVIFSENYASSTWCLNELVKVVECMKQHQRILIPVFYNVPPSDVRYQNNSFKKAFDEHQKKLERNMKVQSWRFALKEAADLSGFHYPSKYRCMLKNVREESQKSGVPHLFEKLVSELLGGECLHLKGSSKAKSSFVQRKLSRKKVFIVLDDMDTLEQFEHLAIQCLGPGSRIIITARDKAVLRKVHGIYEVKGLSSEASLKLFCLNAFEKVYPEVGYEEVSNIAVKYAKGVPLTLKVLGSFLNSKPIEEWESALAKLKIYPNIDIFNVLKLSYDGLDDLEKEIFLDIVFFFKGEDKDVVIPFLESCGFFSAIGIGNLSRKALITISKYNRIEMHDLIEQMGREIVRRESIKDPGRRSRLSNHEEVFNVLKNNKGTDSVEGIMLDLSRIKRDLYLDADTFKKMPNIRFLKFYNSWRYKKSADVYVSSTLESFPNELRYLEWSGCPLKSLPPTFCAEKLVELSMPDSRVSKLWDGVQDLVNLKKINLRACKQLVELPDFTRASNLEEIRLDVCLRLCQLHPSILSMHKLKILSLYCCKKLKSLKGKIHLKSLKRINLLCCSSLKEFSLSSEELTRLNFIGTMIDKLHPSVGRLSKLVKFDLSNARLKTLPNELCLLVSLEELNLKGCKELIELPSNMKALSRSQNLKLTDCCSLRSLPELPPSIIHLCATNCTSLEKLFNAKAVFSLNLVSISFENCKRLDDESFLEYVHQPMMGVAIRDIVGGMLQYTFSLNDNGQVIYPGSEVQSWFKYQTRGSSVTINFEDESCNQLVGFVLCCVVRHAPYRKKDFSTKRPSRISCQFGSWYSKQFARTSSWSSDHVCIWFGKVGCHHHFRDNNVTFKFKCEPYKEDGEFIDGKLLYNYEWEVIGCGVCPVYASDILHVFQNVNPDLQFFYDRYNNGCRNHIDQRVFTLDQVKTRVIHKIKEQQKESSLRTFCWICKEEFWLKESWPGNDIDELDFTLDEELQMELSEDEEEPERILFGDLCLFDEISVESSKVFKIPGSKKVPQSFNNEDENQGVQRKKFPRLPSWPRLETRNFKHRRIC
ncbi:hypothetical protein PIB30_056668 [Stylosanthes scabra]|uniref:ADP-ribosyl cyclase/cyclic ADP-ribose hydrolase n=1 Tax=Stylosanthes scabra TaxID=79078 RepID=A0ABU6XIG5_9FABA|nr:hypothetical protein [Stylosanthes scabra]